MAADIGTRIRRARERLRMSQADLADALKVSRSAVNAWENNRAVPQSSIGALEEILRIDLTSEQPPRLPEPVKIPEHLQRKIDALPPGERDYVMGLLTRPDDASEMPPDQ